MWLKTFCVLQKSFCRRSCLLLNISSTLFSSYLLFTCCLAAAIDYLTDATDWNQSEPLRSFARGWTAWPSGRPRPQTQFMSPSSASMSVASTFWSLWILPERPNSFNLFQQWQMFSSILFHVTAHCRQQCPSCTPFQERKGQQPQQILFAGL